MLGCQIGSLYRWFFIYLSIYFMCLIVLLYRWFFIYLYIYLICLIVLLYRYSSYISIYNILVFNSGNKNKGKRNGAGLAWESLLHCSFANEFAITHAHSSLLMLLKWICSFSVFLLFPLYFEFFAIVFAYLNWLGQGLLKNAYIIIFRSFFVFKIFPNIQIRCALLYM